MSVTILVVDDEPRLRAALVRAGLTCELTLENDAFLTVRAGAPEGHGIGVTAGTGICVAIVRPDGQKYFYGAFTDLGGGIDTATPAFQAVVRAEDGRGRATALTEALLAATGHTSTRDLVYDVHRRGNHVSHTVLNRLLFAAAEEGDPVAVEIVTRFGAELAHAAASLLRRYGLAEQEIAVVAAGSRFAKTGPVLFEAFRRDVLAVSPRARVILSEQPPVVGAVRGALEARGRTAPETWAEVLRSAARTGWFREDMGAPSGGEADAV